MYMLEVNIRFKMSSVHQLFRSYDGFQGISVGQTKNTEPQVREVLQMLT